jgi:hypothetical protein
VWSSPWLGSGFGTFEDALPRFKTGAGNLAVQHAENDLLELLAETGLAGLVCAGALLAAVTKHAVARSTRSPDPLHRGLVAGSAAGIVAVVVHSAFDFNLRIPSNALLAAALMAVCLAAGANTTPRLRNLRAAALVLAVTIGLTLMTPRSPASLDTASLWRTVSAGPVSLRRAEAETEATAYVAARPAAAAGWLALAWLTLERARAEAGELAAWAARLDPSSVAVRDHSARLGAGRR